MKREYGQEHLFAYSEDDTYGPELREFVLRGLPAEVLDAVELYFDVISHYSEDSRSKYYFQAEINRILSEELAPWRLSEGQFFQVDTDFMAAHLQAAEDALHARGFAGALAELREAQNSLTAEDSKGAIVNACKAYESAMKTILGTESGNARALFETWLLGGVVAGQTLEKREF